MVGFIYINNDGTKRRRLWMQTETVLQLGLSLIILGNFNYILNESDKQGSKPFQVNRDIRSLGDLFGDPILLIWDSEGQSILSAIINLAMLGFRR